MSEHDLAATADLRRLFALPDGLLYLDGAAHGPPLRAVREAAARALAGSTRSWFGADWRARVERVRGLAAALFDGDAEAIACVPSAAYGLMLAARCLPLAPGAAVLVLADQFPSNVLPWRQLAAERGGFVVEARREPGQDWTDAVLAALEAEPRVALLALPQVHWRDGARLDLDRIAAAAGDRGAPLVLDLSQSLGAMPVRLDAWRPAFVVSVGYKWLLGGYGLAWLWAGPGHREGTALEQGWMSHDSGALWQGESAPAPLPGARRYDADGTCDAPRLAMAEAGLRQVLAWGPARIAARLATCTDALDAALEARGLGALRIPGHGPHLSGAMLPPGRDPEAAEARARDTLEAAGIAATVHAGRVRIAPHLHVAPEEMTRVADVLAALG